eukprot:24392-Pelagomonas_calceolata.AAC.1
MSVTGKGLMQTSLLPVLPGAAHAAALSIAQRQSASSTTDAVGTSSDVLTLVTSFLSLISRVG